MAKPAENNFSPDEECDYDADLEIAEQLNNEFNGFGSAGFGSATLQFYESGSDLLYIHILATKSNQPN